MEQGGSFLKFYKLTHSLRITGKKCRLLSDAFGLRQVVGNDYYGQLGFEIHY